MDTTIDAPDIFRVVADPVRRRILDLVGDEPRTVGELVAEFEISQPAVSQHLAVLRDARLVSASVEGRHRRYHLTASPLREIADWLAYYERFWDDAIDRLGTHLEETRRGE